MVRVKKCSESYDFLLCGMALIMVAMIATPRFARAQTGDHSNHVATPHCDIFAPQSITHEAKFYTLPLTSCSYCTAEFARLQQQRASYDAPRRPYNVLSYTLFMDWSQALSQTGEVGAVRQFTGRNTIALRIDSINVQTLIFHSATMRIDSCFVHGRRITQPIFVDETRTECAVPLDFTPRVGDSVSVDFFYTHTSPDNSATSGFYLYDRNRIGEIPRYTANGIPRIDTFYTAERSAYTMSQPNNARNWMPCNDTPNDKALATITIRVPQGFTALSNGLLQSSTSTVAGTIDYRWQTRLPIPTYLMNGAASRYVEYGETLPALRGALGSRDSLAVRYFVWQPDYDQTITDGTRYNARMALRSTPGMITGLERYFGVYPFEKYYTVAVQPYLYGGMEHQTMTIINRNWLRGQDLGLAHEVAHHWLGNKVTCGSWADIWMNEGGATWSEALWMESFGAADLYQGFIRNRTNLYLTLGGIALPALYQPPADQLFATATTYFKAGLVYNMMRRMVGDSLFFPALRSYIEEFAYSTATTADMQRSFERAISNPPIAWSTFFRQWVYQAGHPQFVVSSVQQVLSSSPPRTQVEITVNQVQSATFANVPSAFEVIAPIVFVGNRGQRQTFPLRITERTQRTSIIVPFVPDSVLFDPDDTILCEKIVNPRPTSVQSISQRPYSASIFPQPVITGEPLQYVLSENIALPAVLEIIDLQGRIVATHTMNSLTGILPTSGLARGVYGVRYATREGIRVMMMLLQ
jgi:hypothetical protein